MQDERYTIVFAGGGTGGHLFPALAVAAELGRRHPGAAISFVGAQRGLEQRLVPAAGYPLRSLRISGLKGQGLLGRARGVLAAGGAVLRCLAWMRSLRPQLVVGVGGYASGPAVLAASWLGVRTMVMEQNHFPGATNRWLAPRVDAVCVPSEAARERLGGVGTVTGNPVRAEFAAIGPPPGGDRLSLLVLGGSRGAHSVNRAMSAAVPELARLASPPRIVHQTGGDDERDVRASYADYPDGAWEVHAFLDDVPSRLAAADLVVSRAGATTLAELSVAGRGAILVPYPYAADDHQRHNAEALVEVGAAELVLDADLDGELLARKIGRLAAEPEAVKRMSRAARKLARPHATAAICDVADGLLRGDRPADTPGDTDVP